MAVESNEFSVKIEGPPRAFPVSKPIDVRGIELDVRATNANWFPVRIGHNTAMPVTLYLRRSELRQLRARLESIDRAMSEPTR